MADSMDDRYLFSMMNLIGRNVLVRKTSGCILSGVVCSTSLPSAGEQPADAAYKDGMTLRYISHVGGPEPSEDLPRRERVKISWDEIESVTAKSAGGPLGYAQTAEELATVMSSSVSASKKNKGHLVETDTKISSKNASAAASSSSKQQGAAPAKKRDELKAVPSEWLAAPAPNAPSESGGGAGFDQFKVNETKFGVKSTYKEEFYTTKLDLAKVTPEQTARAEKLAREIESTGSSNVHTLEERGISNPSSALDEDEEAKYGAVLGSGGYQDGFKDGKSTTTNSSSSTNGKYKPPQMRDKEKQQPQQSAPPPLSVPKASPPPMSYASMVKGAADASTPTVVAPKASKPSGSGSGKPSSSKEGGPSTPGSAPKTREDIIREFKEFSQSYVSPSAKPKLSRGMTPPDMALEQSPSKASPQLHQNNAQGAAVTTNSVVTASKPVAASESPAGTEPAKASPMPATAASTTSTPPSSGAESKPLKKSLNPNAKNFNPSAPSFVPGGGGGGGSNLVPMQQQQPQQGMMYARGAPPPPRMIQFSAPPPPVMAYQPAQQVFFQGGPQGAFMMPIAYPGTQGYPGGPGARPIMVYPPGTGPQMYPQPVLIPVHQAGSYGVPPPPMAMAVPPGVVAAGAPPRSPQVIAAAPTPVLVVPQPHPATVVIAAPPQALPGGSPAAAAPASTSSS